MRDVAARAGVSVATASRVLNAPDKVAQDTRRRVESAISELRFIPSAAARAINRGRSGLVAALLPTLDNAIYARVVNGVETRLAARQMSLTVAQTGDDLQTELTRAEQMVDIGVEALIVVGVTHDPGLLDLMDRAQIPVVAISYFDETCVLPTIGYDNWAAAETAARHLSALGHHKIAVLHGPVETNDRMRRRKAALEAMSGTLDLSFFEVPLSPEGGHMGIAALMERSQRPSAVLCFSDVIAHGAMSRLQILGISVPDQMSVIGMEDLPGSKFTHPTLTSVRLSVEEMGEQAAEAVLTWLTEDVRPAPIRLPIDLISRESTAAPS
ncbi:MAG: LacI family DNA-binding transcriptional regulator [Pseudomonadota bacterium]